MTSATRLVARRLQLDPLSELPPLTEAQIEIMNVVWDRGETTLGEVWGELSARRKVARNTVQTLLNRLVEKGWLRARPSGKAFRYSAAVPRESTLRQMVRQFVRTAFAGSAEGMMMALLEGSELSKEEADRIRSLIEKAERDEP
jgi:predicted transcriptional regulator